MDLEVTTSYDEIVFVTQSAGTPTDTDQEDPPRLVRDHDESHAAPDADRHQHRHNGHAHDTARRNGHLRDHDSSYPGSHERFEPGRDGEQDEMEMDFAASDSEGVAPRGDVRGDVGPLIDDLKALFQRDRATASATGGTRCGICYLHFALDALEYREAEGYYVCADCARALGAAHLPMVRRQKRG